MRQASVFTDRFVQLLIRQERLTALDKVANGSQNRCLQPVLKVFDSQELANYSDESEEGDYEKWHG